MFKDRIEAGEKLAERLKEEAFPKETLILAVPKGGVPVGEQISHILGLPLDYLIIQKIPAPESDDLAIGALGKGGVVVWEEELCRKLNVPLDFRQQVVKQKITELEKKDEELRGEKTSPRVEGQTILLVDDGVVTGATLKAAIMVIRNFHPAEIVVAVPIIAVDALEGIKQIADRLVYLESPELLFSLTEFYKN